MMVMPAEGFVLLTDEDLGRIIAFLKSLPAVSGPGPGSVSDACDVREKPVGAKPHQGSSRARNRRDLCLLLQPHGLGHQPPQLAPQPLPRV